MPDQSRPTPFTLLGMYEYKVFTFDKARGLGISGLVRPDVLEAMLNDHAAEGWRVVSCTPGISGGKGGSAELVIVLERPRRG
jgi:hypothetical protein